MEPCRGGGWRNVMFNPSLEEFVARSERGNLVPVYREILADLETPVSAFLKVGGRPHSFLLESVAGGEQIGRYSFIGGEPFMVLKTKGRDVEITRDGRTERRALAEGEDPLHVLKELLSAFRFVKDPELPPFCGGAVGYIGYDTVRFFEPRLGAAPPDDRGLPDCCFVFTDTLLIFDHVKHRIKVLCLARVKGDAEAAYDSAVAKVDGLIRALRRPLGAAGQGALGGLLSPEDLAQARETASRMGADLEAALIRGRIVKPFQLVQAKAYLANMRAVDLETTPPEPDAIQSVPAALARRLGALPLRRMTHGDVELLIVSIGDAGSRERVERELGEATGLKVQAVFADPQLVRKAIDVHYPERGGSAEFGTPVAPAVTSIPSREEHEAAVLKAKEYIAAGDIIQVVLSRRMQVDVTTSAFQIYRALRSVNPSPYMFFLQFQDCQLIGASPEILVTERAGQVVTRPIAGTIRRGGTPEEDAELEAQLLADPKERAEHIMLVDLHRNDIGRVCEYGSVAVDQLMVTEKYSHVIHIVSNVVGKLRPDKDAFDLIRATFPAGTLSGAPKIRAMEIIDELEPAKRGPYGGCIGYFSFSGDMDTAITLRTIVMKDRTAYVQAGGGIVADSDPAAEFEETERKAGALMRAIEMAERGLE
jgi:anthranilate/para-aminobenzoate synthase component I